MTKIDLKHEKENYYEKENETNYETNMKKLINTKKKYSRYVPRSQSKQIIIQSDYLDPSIYY